MIALKAREKRMLVYLGVFLAVVAWDTARRRGSPDVVEETEHYVIYSTATQDQTAEIGHVAEIVYAGYRQLGDRLACEIHSHPKLKIRLFKDRKEFRHCNRIVDGSLALGQIDTNTYPVWWLDSMATSGDLESDKRNVTIIPLRRIIAGRGGSGMNDHFNLYYLHWWSLTRFLMEYQEGIYLPGFRRLLADGADLAAFEKHIGQIEAIEGQWYRYVLDLKRDLAGRVTPSVKWDLERAVDETAGHHLRNEQR